MRGDPLGVVLKHLCVEGRLAPRGAERAMLLSTSFHLVVALHRTNRAVLLPKSLSPQSRHHVPAKITQEYATER